MREALLKNLKGSTPKELKEIIEQGILSKEETILVGLGVLFEHYYNSIDDQAKDTLLTSLSKLL